MDKLEQEVIKTFKFFLFHPKLDVDSISGVVRLSENSATLSDLQLEYTRTSTLKYSQNQELNLPMSLDQLNDELTTSIINKTRSLRLAQKPNFRNAIRVYVIKKQLSSHDIMLCKEYWNTP